MANSKVTSPEPAAAPAAEATMATGVVERGRSILAPHPDPTRLRGVRYTREGQPIAIRELVEFLPGDEFTAPLAEIERLRSIGFLRDENRYASVDNDAAA